MNENINDIRPCKDKPLICVPITSLVKAGILDEAGKIADSRADMAEWRIDYYAGSQADIPGIISELKSILGSKKLIATLRTEYEGGEENGSGFDYFSVIEAVINDDTADYVDVEMNRDESRLMELKRLKEGKGIKLIGSYHDFDGMPDKAYIVQTLTKAKVLGCDVGKIACMAASEEDAYTMLVATDEIHKTNPDFPLITMAMGRYGSMTRLYGGLYGSGVTFAALKKASAPGQRSLAEMLNVFDKLYASPGHIFLTGFMGTGKSTIAERISTSYSMPAVDTDDMIEQSTGEKISDIFSKKGEKRFRKMESDILDELGGLERSIVSLGGGVVINELNVRKLKLMGTIVWLTASPQTIFERVNGSVTRPLLKDNMNVDYISQLMKARLPMYEACADVTVDTDGISVASVARAVMDSVK